MTLTWTQLQGRQTDVCACGHYRFKHAELTGACEVGSASKRRKRCGCEEFADGNATAPPPTLEASE